MYPQGSLEKEGNSVIRDDMDEAREHCVKGHKPGTKDQSTHFFLHVECETETHRREENGRKRETMA